MITERTLSRERVGTQFVGRVNGLKTRIVKMVDDRTALHCWAFAQSGENIRPMSSMTAATYVRNGKFKKFTPLVVRGADVLINQADSLYQGTR